MDALLQANRQFAETNQMTTQFNMVSCTRQKEIDSPTEMSVSLSQRNIISQNKIQHYHLLTGCSWHDENTAHRMTLSFQRKQYTKTTCAVLDSSQLRRQFQ